MTRSTSVATARRVPEVLQGVVRGELPEVEGILSQLLERLSVGTDSPWHDCRRPPTRIRILYEQSSPACPGDATVR